MREANEERQTPEEASVAWFWRYVRGFARGDLRSLPDDAQAFGRVWGALRRMAAARSGLPQDAPDVEILAEAAFDRAVRALAKKLDDNATKPLSWPALLGYLKRCVCNAATDHARRAEHRKRRGGSDDIEQLSAERATSKIEPPCGQDDDESVRRRAERLITPVLDKLCERYPNDARLLVLRVVAGLSYAEICEREGVAPDKTGQDRYAQRFRRAAERFRKLFEEIHGVGGGDEIADWLYSW